MGRLIDVDTLKDKMIKYGFHAVDMTVTEFVDDMLPTVEAIPKADYEARLKADMVAMLTDIQLEMESLKFGQPPRKYVVYECLNVIQQKKIDALKVRGT